MPTTITLDHGSGGLYTHNLIKGIIVRHLTNPLLDPLEDSALLKIGHYRSIAFTTDSYVVDPIFFSGGDIGSLSVNGTINDLAMKGAWPIALSCSFILEEGLGLTDFEKVVLSIKNACETANVMVATGDTKVVPRGKCDRLFITTSGVGLVKEGIDIGISNIRDGDMIIVSGEIGSHGITILTEREGMDIKSPSIKSDTCALHRLVSALIDDIGDGLHALKDPTRGGLCTALWEASDTTGYLMDIFEEKIPINNDVRGASYILGIDPLYLANEGKLIAWIDPLYAERAIAIMKAFDCAKDAAVIGEVKGRVIDDNAPSVILHTAIGGKRRLHPLKGMPLPRIC